jgi:hypothetical protein
MLVQLQQAATVCELDLVQVPHRVMETGSDLGSEPTTGEPPHEPLNPTLDSDHAHVNGHSYY